jgi:hypothetical protein
MSGRSTYRFETASPIHLSCTKPLVTEAMEWGWICDCGPCPPLSCAVRTSGAFVGRSRAGPEAVAISPTATRLRLSRTDLGAAELKAQTDSVTGGAVAQGQANPFAGSLNRTSHTTRRRSAGPPHRAGTGVLHLHHFHGLPGGSKGDILWDAAFGAVIFRLSQLVAVRVHHLCPGRDEVLDELRL